MITPTAIPYHNLILTGYMGVGKLLVGRIIGKRLGVEFIDLNAELELREGVSSDQIKQLYGNSRLTALESELCRELALKRGTVLSIGGGTLLDPTNRERLLNGGMILVLTCALDQILRRLYAAQGERFHNPRERLIALTQVKREKQIHQIPDLPTVDTTYLTPEEIADQAIQFWYAQETMAFH